MEKYKPPQKRPMEPKALWAIYYPIGYLIAKFIAKYTKLTPNTITFLVLIYSFLPLYLYSTGNFVLIAISGILIQLIVVGDVVDGRVAELTKKSTSLGEWIDGMVALIADALIFGGIGYGMYKLTDDVNIWIYIFIIISANFLIYLSHKIFLMIDPGFRKIQGSEIKSNFWISLFIWGRAKIYIITGTISIITGLLHNISVFYYFLICLSILNVCFFILLFIYFAHRLNIIDTNK